ncbi:MAG: hypothetical protein WDW36_009057 [Sanguina aurantia]
MAAKDPMVKLAEYKEAFQLFDNDGDGCITTSVLGTVMRALGKSPTEAQIREIIKDVDPEGRGLVDFKEFVGAMGKDMRDHDNEADLRAAWNVLDKEKRGLISVKDLRHVLGSVGEKLSPSELDDLSREADPESTGFISYPVFLKAMLAK